MYFFQSIPIIKSNVCDAWWRKVNLTSSLASTSRRPQWWGATLQNPAGQWWGTGGATEPALSWGTRRGSGGEHQRCHFIWVISTSWCATQTRRYTDVQSWIAQVWHGKEKLYHSDLLLSVQVFLDLLWERWPLQPVAVLCLSPGLQLKGSYCIMWWSG